MFKLQKIISVEGAVPLMFLKIFPISSTTIVKSFLYFLKQLLKSSFMSLRCHQKTLRATATYHPIGRQVNEL